MDALEEDTRAVLASMIGKTMQSVVAVTVPNAYKGRPNQIDFHAESGERYRMYHDQDCCESTDIEDIVGDLSDLVGSPIVMAEVVTSQTDPQRTDSFSESWTWTYYKFATAKGYVTIRWYGDSNGYYSEFARFVRVDTE